MLKFDVILWDIDGTLLDFHAAQRCGIRACFEQFELGECTDDMLADYSEINQKYWRALERNEIEKPQVLTGRFFEFFEKYGLDTSIVEDFNEAYQLSLGDTICFFDGAKDVLNACKKAGILNFAVTNGTLRAQEKKLKNSGLIDIFDDVFISDVVGVEKPNIGFFEPVFEKIKNCLNTVDKDRILIVGDSMTSDMQGGFNAKIKTCLFNQSGHSATNASQLDYCITSLKDVLKISGVI